VEERTLFTMLLPRPAGLFTLARFTGSDSGHDYLDDKRSAALSWKRKLFSFIFESRIQPFTFVELLCFLLGVSILAIARLPCARRHPAQRKRV
jgi:hypothetical protein